MCPVSAIQSPLDGLDPFWVEDNRAFFELPLPTRSEPIGSPGGASALGPVGVDTPLVTELAANQ